MNKEEFKKFIDTLNLPKDQYFICSGGALLMMGIRGMTSDLDMCITPSLFKDLSSKYEVKKSEKDFPNLFYINDLIEFFVEEKLDSVMIDGYPCETLESILRFKEKHRRPKDLIDIENIKAYLKRTI